MQFEVGDWAYLKLHPYRLCSLAAKRNEKLQPRFYGPFQVQEWIGQVAYRLSLRPTSRVHPVFPVSLLKKALPPHCAPLPLPLELSDEMELQALLDFRYSKADQAEVLVRWEGMPSCEDSWEDVQKLLHQFPLSHLEDKVKALGGVLV